MLNVTAASERLDACDTENRLVNLVAVALSSKGKSVNVLTISVSPLD